MTEQSKERYITIKEMFEDILDNQEVQIFRFVYDGNLSVGTNKRLARVSISIPKTICHDNLETLREFVIFGVAIPTKVIENLPDKKEDQNGSSN